MVPELKVITGEANLELKIITLNINEGHNKELMEQCRILREYALYVAKVREYARDFELDAAVEKAVNYCIQNDILAEFLRENKSEVIATSIFEYDKEEEEKKLRKAEYEAGMTEGENHLKLLYSKLKQDGRVDEFLQAMTDSEVLKKLYLEYKIE